LCAAQHLPWRDTSPGQPPRAEPQSLIPRQASMVAERPRSLPSPRALAACPNPGEPPPPALATGESAQPVPLWSMPPSVVVGQLKEKRFAGSRIKETPALVPCMHERRRKPSNGPHLHASRLHNFPPACRHFFSTPCNPRERKISPPCIIVAMCQPSIGLSGLWDLVWPQSCDPLCGLVFGQ
jgi:hypothetical protein